MLSYCLSNSLELLYFRILYFLLWSFVLLMRRHSENCFSLYLSLYILITCRHEHETSAAIEGKKVFYGGVCFRGILNHFIKFITQQTHLCFRRIKINRKKLFSEQNEMWRGKDCLVFYTRMQFTHLKMKTIVCFCIWKKQIWTLSNANSRSLKSKFLKEVLFHFPKIYAWTN